MPVAYRPHRRAGRDRERRGRWPRDEPVGPAILLGGDRGAVTVEAALALVSLVAVMAVAVCAVAAASAHLRCLDAAREAARLVARGEPERARSVAAAIAPGRARMVVTVVGDEVQVDVSTAVVPGLPGLTLDARAVGVLEPAALTGPDGVSHPVRGAPSDFTSAASRPPATDEFDVPHRATGHPSPEGPG